MQNPCHKYIVLKLPDLAVIYRGVLKKEVPGVLKKPQMWR